MTDLRDLERCCEGVVPAVIATADGAGTPNVTYLSRVRIVDEERVALSNQFFSKTARNLAQNPRASLLVVDPTTYDEYRLTLVYERTERRGPVFDRLKGDVDTIAALHGMQDVFRLRGADVYRVVDLEFLPGRGPVPDDVRAHDATVAGATGGVAGIAELAARVARCGDLDALVATTVDALDSLLGYRQSVILLLDEAGRSLYTIASRGFGDEGVGSEVAVGEGVAGMAAARAAPIRVGNLRQIAKYSESVRRAYDATAIPLPALPDVQSRLAVPLTALGQVVGVLLVEDAQPAAFDEQDEAVLSAVGALVGAAVELARAEAERDDSVGPPAGARPAAPADMPDAARVRFFAVDGSTFVDGDYLIKGVAGRILWALLGHHEREGRTEFTNREVRLDPALELPGFKDNFESRLILLKRRLDERDAPVRIEKTGRGRFRLDVRGPVRLEDGGAGSLPSGG